jgi:hypothetical protein
MDPLTISLIISAIALAEKLIVGAGKLSRGEQPTPEEQAALDLSITAKRDELREHVDRLTGRNQ